MTDRTLQRVADDFYWASLIKRSHECMDILIKDWGLHPENFYIVPEDDTELTMCAGRDMPRRYVDLGRWDAQGIILAGFYSAPVGMALVTSCHFDAEGDPEDPYYVLEEMKLWTDLHKAGEIVP